MFNPCCEAQFLRPSADMRRNHSIRNDSKLPDFLPHIVRLPLLFSSCQFLFCCLTDWTSLTLELCWIISFCCYTAHSRQCESRGFTALSTVSFSQKGLLLLAVDKCGHWCAQLSLRNSSKSTHLMWHLTRNDTTGVSHTIFFYFFAFEALLLNFISRKSLHVRNHTQNIPQI